VRQGETAINESPLSLLSPLISTFKFLNISIWNKFNFTTFFILVWWMTTIIGYVWTKINGKSTCRRIKLYYSFNFLHVYNRNTRLTNILRNRLNEQWQIEKCILMCVYIPPIEKVSISVFKVYGSRFKVPVPALTITIRTQD